MKLNIKLSFFRYLGFVLLLSAGSIHPGNVVAAQETLFIVNPTSGLQTSESGGQATFTVALGSQPDSAVQVYLASSDPTEGAVSPSKLTLTPGTWYSPQWVTVTGLGDGLVDGDQSYAIILSPAFSNDPLFDDQNPPDVAVNNLDVDPLPQANDDSDLTSQGEVVATDVLANDLNLGPGPHTITITLQPVHGTATVIPGNLISYDPEPSFAGLDAYQYQVCNSQGFCGGAEVTVLVQAVNHAPVAVGDVHNTGMDSPSIIDVLSNDYDEDGDPLYLVSFDPASFYGGSVSRIDNDTPDDSGDDQLSYNPPPGFDGSDTFSYSINDGELAAITTVTVMVGVAINTPIANDDNYTTGPDSPLIVTSAAGVLANDQDVNGTGLAAILVSGTTSGTLDFNEDGSFTYSPGAGFSGVDQFDYILDDGSAESNEATVTITVTEIDFAPVAADDAYTVGQLESLDVPSPGLLENDGDANGDELKALLVSAPVHGNLTLNEDGSFAYLPAEGYVGPDTFIYFNEAAEQKSNHATVTIDILDQISPTLSWALPILDGGVYDVGTQPIQLQILAEDNVSVERIEIFRWDAVGEKFVDIATLEDPPFSYELDTQTLNPEWNQVFAIAYDAEDNPSERQFIWLYRMVPELVFLPLAIR
jgi:hypothetical protein